LAFNNVKGDGLAIVYSSWLSHFEIIILAEKEEAVVVGKYTLGS